MLSRLEDFMSRLSILCRDRVGQGKEKLCRDIIVYVTTELAKEGKFISRRNVIMSRQSCPTWGEFMSCPSILHCDRKSHDISFPCRDIAFYVTTVG